MLILMYTVWQKKSIWHYLRAPVSENRTSLALKFTYLFLQLLDLGLTMLAVNFGFAELNPFIKGLLASPVQLLAVKLFIPLLIVRFLPGKFLIPGILLLLVVVAWNVQELLSVVL